MCNRGHGCQEGLVEMIYDGTRFHLVISLIRLISVIREIERCTNFKKAMTSQNFRNDRRVYFRVEASIELEFWQNVSSFHVWNGSPLWNLYSRDWGLPILFNKSSSRHAFSKVTSGDGKPSHGAELRPNLLWMMRRDAQFQRRKITVKSQWPTCNSLQKSIH